MQIRIPFVAYKQYKLRYSHLMVNHGHVAETTWQYISILYTNYLLREINGL